MLATVLYSHRLFCKKNNDIVAAGEHSQTREKQENNFGKGSQRWGAKGLKAKQL